MLESLYYLDNKEPDMTATATATTTSVSTIVPRDLSTSTTDVNRDTWTPGKMSCVIDALAGRKVLIVIDTATGFTLMGVTLVGVTQGHSHSYNVVVESTFEDGTTQRTAYFLPKVGAIVELDRPEVGSGVRFAASSVKMDRERRAISLGRSEVAGTGREYGKWEATLLTATETSVRYTPQNGPNAGTAWSGRVRA